MQNSNLRIDGARLMRRLEELRLAGDTGDGGSRRLALSDTDKAGRDLFCAWIEAAGLELHVDRIGNIVGVLPGETDAPAIMVGSHIDTVGSGGKFDGALGAVGGLEVLATLRQAGVTPRRALAVIAFTNEEGARFQPDVLGSCVWCGDMSVEDAEAVVDSDGRSVGAELRRIGYAGTAEPGFLKTQAYLELHIEQGPILDKEGGGIGAVTGVQAIWWSELTLTGEPNHAGTTPMKYRRNAALAAARIILFLDQLTREVEGTVANTGRIVTEPGNVNVVPGRIKMTVDLRNPDDARLAEVERRLNDFLADLQRETSIAVSSRELARFPAQPFDAAMIDAVEAAAARLGHKVRRMHSGAGHDAQMMATIVPTAMIFVPSVNGMSHNPNEFTRDEDCIAGANVLLAAALELANAPPRA